MKVPEELVKHLLGEVATCLPTYLTTYKPSWLPTHHLAGISTLGIQSQGIRSKDWFFAFQLVFVLLVTTIVGTILNVSLAFNWCRSQALMVGSLVGPERKLDPECSEWMLSECFQSHFFIADLFTMCKIQTLQLSSCSLLHIIPFLNSSL